MQVVSGRLGRPRVHFEAPPGDRLEPELEAFLAWFNHPPAGSIRCFARASPISGW